MWTAENRPRYNRDKLRYPSDLTDAEWALIEPLIPPGKPGGGKRRIDTLCNGLVGNLSLGIKEHCVTSGFTTGPTIFAPFHIRVVCADSPLHRRAHH